MAKTKAQKGEQLKNLNDRLERMKSAVFVDYKGLKVKETEELRRNLRSQAVDFNVAKVSLAKIALNKKGIEIDEKIFEKPLAIAFGMKDEIVPAREINNFAKSNESLEILGGILEGQFIDADKVKALAGLPSREELLSKVVGSLSAPLSGMVNVLAGNIRGLINVLNARKEKIA